MTGRAARGHYFEKAEDLMHLSIVLEPAGHCGHAIELPAINSPVSN